MTLYHLLFLSFLLYPAKGYIDSWRAQDAVWAQPGPRCLTATLLLSCLFRAAANINCYALMRLQFEFLGIIVLELLRPALSGGVDVCRNLLKVRGGGALTTNRYEWLFVAGGLLTPSPDYARRVGGCSLNV
jgi:hypothetical protein